MLLLALPKTTSYACPRNELNRILRGTVCAVTLRYCQWCLSLTIYTGCRETVCSKRMSSKFSSTSLHPPTNPGLGVKSALCSPVNDCLSDPAVWHLMTTKISHCPLHPYRNFCRLCYFFISFLSGTSQSPRIVYFPGEKRSNCLQAKNSPTSTYWAHLLTYALKCFPSLLRARNIREMSEIGIHAQEWVQNEFTVVCLEAPCLDYGWHYWLEWWRIYEKRD